MLKKKLPLLLITSCVILIPLLAGVFLWDLLPDKIAIHWNTEGVADSFGSKTLAVFGLPAFLLGIHWLCTLATFADPKRKNVDGKPLTLVLWLCPVLSLLVGTVVYMTALGYNLRVEIIVPMVLGILFIVIGNYLPKCRQNYTVGIKVPWTLHDTENWNKTHRFAGILWVIGGIVILATAFLGSIYILLPVFLLMAFLPVVYSYCLHRRKL